MQRSLHKAVGLEHRILKKEVFHVIREGLKVSMGGVHEAHEALCLWLNFWVYVTHFVHVCDCENTKHSHEGVLGPFCPGKGGAGHRLGDAAMPCGPVSSCRAPSRPGLARPGGGVPEAPWHPVH